MHVLVEHVLILVPQQHELNSILAGIYRGFSLFYSVTVGPSIWGAVVFAPDMLDDYYLNVRLCAIIEILRSHWQEIHVHFFFFFGKRLVRSC